MTGEPASELDGREGRDQHLGAERLEQGAIDRPIGPARRRHQITVGKEGLDRAGATLRAEGYVLRDADIEHLPPLVHEHINLHGHYYFGVTEAVQHGELRFLRNPRDAIQEI